MSEKSQSKRAGNDADTTFSLPPEPEPTAARKKDSHNTERLKWEDHVIVDHDLSSVAYRVGSYIASHLNEKTRKAWPSTSLIEERLGLPRNTVFKAIRELKDRGHLATSKRKVKGGGNFNEYWLTLGSVSKVKRSPLKQRPAQAKSSFKDQSPLKRFLVEYPLRGVADYEPAVQAEIDRAVAVGHSIEALIVAAEVFRRLC